MRYCEFVTVQDRSIGRSIVAGTLSAIAGLGPLVILSSFVADTPNHHNIGGFSGWLRHVIGATLVGGLVILVFGSLVLAARAIAPSFKWVWAAGSFVLIYGAAVGWRTFDAANVLLDDTPREIHIVRFVGFRQPSKGPSLTTVSSWNDAGTEEIPFYTREAEQQPGRPMRLVLGHGALGRAYVLSLDAL